MLQKELEKHLRLLQRQGDIITWQKRNIGAGRVWVDEADTHLNTAQIILLLISSNFLNSDYCYSKELTRALARHEANEAHVIPIMLRPVSWEGAPFSKLQMLPKDGIPIESPHWFSRDEAWLNVVGELRNVIAELTTMQILSSPTPPPHIWFVPDRRNPFFTGRKDLLKQLHDRLAACRTAALTQTQAISGLGGIGKSQVALEYAYRYQREYRAVLWVNASSEETLLADFVKLANKVGLPQQENKGPQEITKAMKIWLSRQKDWLLILDNVDDFDLIGDYLPEEAKSNCHIILTTRAQATGSIAHTLEVDTMNNEEGVLLVLRRAKIVSPGADLDQVTHKLRLDAETIVTEMDGLPLALDQAGAYIEETGCTFLGYLDLYRRRRRKELLGRRGHVPPGHPDPVTTTWDISFRLVGQANPAAANLLRLCAFLDPSAIPKSIIMQAASSLGFVSEPDIVDTFALNKVIEELRKFSLIRRNAEAGLLSLHRLVQAVLRDGMEIKLQKQWAKRAIKAVCAVFPDERWQSVHHLLPQALACIMHIEQYDFAFPEAIRLLDQTATYLRDYAHYQQAEAIFQRAVDISEKMHGPDYLNITSILSKLASLYRKQGRYEKVLPLYQRCLDIFEKAYGPDHLNANTAIILSNLASYYRDQGQLEQAEHLFLRALDIKKQTLPPDHPEIAITLENLARLYLAQSREDQAKPLFQHALAIYEQELGPDHPYTATMLDFLAGLYHKQDNDEQAEAFFKRALAIREQVLGSDHPRTAITIYNLAQLYYDQGKYEQAEPLFQQALVINQQALGPSHPNTITNIKGYAQFLLQTDRREEAENLLAHPTSVIFP